MQLTEWEQANRNDPHYLLGAAKQGLRNALRKLEFLETRTDEHVQQELRWLKADIERTLDFCKTEADDK